MSVFCENLRISDADFATVCTPIFQLDLTAISLVGKDYKDTQAFGQANCRPFDEPSSRSARPTAVLRSTELSATLDDFTQRISGTLSSCHVAPLLSVHSVCNRPFRGELDGIDRIKAT